MDDFLTIGSHSTLEEVLSHFGKEKLYVVPNNSLFMKSETELFEVFFRKEGLKVNTYNRGVIRTWPMLQNVSEERRCFGLLHF